MKLSTSSKDYLSLVHHRNLYYIRTYNPGKCGISDYIQLLSEKLRNLGHEVSHASVHNDLIQNYPDHDLYSIQFAPYAFSSNGVLNKRILRLAKSLKSQKTHINFHEIWIGAYPKASFKEKFTGWRQKFKILTFFNNLIQIFDYKRCCIDRLALLGSKRIIYFWKHTTVANLQNRRKKIMRHSYFWNPLEFHTVYWGIK